MVHGFEEAENDRGNSHVAEKQALVVARDEVIYCDVKESVDQAVHENWQMQVNVFLIQ